MLKLFAILQLISLILPPPQGKSYYLMGTYSYIEMPSADLNKKAYKILHDIETKLSDYIDSSEVSRINANAGKNFLKVSSITMEMIKKAIEVSEKSFGYFDITIGALTINAKRLKKIDEFRAKELVNFKDILIKGDSVMLKRENMAIDPGGIGKGFAIEMCYKKLNSKKGFISIGGDMKIWGHKRTIAVRDPRNGTSLVQMVNSKDVSISTSGNYLRKHIETPEDDVLQVTVAHEDGGFADAYSTAIFAMPEKMRRKFIEDNPDVGVLIVYKDGSIFINKRFMEFFEILLFKTNSEKQRRKN
ncbi:thiamine biosynthesis lipoprotein [Candidatus Thermokryptus mobilis]|uniref:FAD:protein FMN transferase n=1 Tax=Candidatus Thermokryptus mobilis TaxID=1643428 RepID=A0A0S4N761_9BACT|nr:FAD:protein FMN transferase [Candidatus Thermokryptus mobilis]CUU07079.1 thiamine biosynthesis lipoprotein [Candidatus Thermokryptus mobilis]